MRVVRQSYKILGDIHSSAFIHRIAQAARTCYQSDSGVGDDAKDESLVRRLIFSGHEAMLEHAGLTVEFLTDRGVANELVRHRVASFAQESTRYCNYSKGKFDGEISVIAPETLMVPSKAFQCWATACMEAEREYLAMLESGASVEDARDVLPLCLATHIVVTANIREWRHIFKLRALGTTGKPHPKMQALMKPLYDELAAAQPALFGDLIELANSANS